MAQFRIFILILVAAGTTTLLVPDALAQVGGGFGGSMGGGMGGRSHGGRNTNGDTSGESKTNAEKRPEIPDPNGFEQISYRLSLIQEELKLEPGQLGAWLSFASKVRSYAADLAREKSNVSANAFQAIGLQHIEQALDTARNRLTALEDIESSTKSLYFALKPEQKILLDKRIPTIVAPRSAPPGTIPPPPSAVDRR